MSFVARTLVLITICGLVMQTVPGSSDSLKADGSQSPQSASGRSADNAVRRVASPALLFQLRRNARCLHTDAVRCFDLCSETIAGAEQAGDAAVVATATMQRACASMDVRGVQDGASDFKQALGMFPDDAPDEIRLLFVQARSFHDRYFFHSGGFAPNTLKYELGMPSTAVDLDLRLTAQLDLLSYLIRTTSVDERMFSPANALLPASTLVENKLRLEFLKLKNRSIRSVDDADCLRDGQEIVQRPQFRLCSRRFQAESLLFCGEMFAAAGEHEEAFKSLQNALTLAEELHDGTLSAECQISLEALPSERNHAASFSLLWRNRDTWLNVINDPILLNRCIQVFDKALEDHEKSTQLGKFVNAVLERTRLLELHKDQSEHDLRQRETAITNAMLVRQEESQRQLAATNALSESASRWFQLVSRVGFGVCCLMALFLFRDRRRLRRVNRQLKCELQKSELQRQEKERIELRLAQTERLESLGSLAGGVAHDFNNLLVGVLGNAELLKYASASDDVSTRYVERIIQSAETAAELSRKMLVYAGKEPGSRKVLSLNDLIGRMMPLLRAGIGSRQTLNFEPDPEQLLTEADAGQLDQVLLNLVTNAAQAMSEAPGKVTVRTGTSALPEVTVDPPTFGVRKQGGEFVWFEVCDTGSGIPGNDLSRVFEPFFTTRKGAGGHGFGLAVVYGHVNRHDGLIQVTSIMGQGSCFRILLPVSRSPLPERVSESPRVPAVVSSRARVIVAVDDQQCVLDVLTNTLRSETTVVHAFSNVTDALEFFADHHHVDCLLLDLMMPGLDGSAMLEEMKQRTIAVPVILVSGFSTVNLEEFLRFPCVRAVIEKPFRPAQLIETVNSVFAMERKADSIVPPLRDSSV